MPLFLHFFRARAESDFEKLEFFLNLFQCFILRKVKKPGETMSKRGKDLFRERREYQGWYPPWEKRRALR